MPLWLRCDGVRLHVRERRLGAFFDQPTNETSRSHLLRIHRIQFNSFQSREEGTRWPKFAHASRALIVEDEPLFAMGLIVDMQALGFDTCE